MSKDRQSIGEELQPNDLDDDIAVETNGQDNAVNGRLRKLESLARIMSKQKAMVSLVDRSNPREQAESPMDSYADRIHTPRHRGHGTSPWRRGTRRRGPSAQPQGPSATRNLEPDQGKPQAQSTRNLGPGQKKGDPPSPVDEPRTRPGETPDLVDKVHPPSRAQRQGTSNRTRGNPRPSRQGTSDQAKGRPSGPVDEPQTRPGETPDLVDKVHPPVGDSAW
eukprot:SAG11_NODE_3005_length_2773_cov_7.231488_1_plen_221_part_00